MCKATDFIVCSVVEHYFELNKYNFVVLRSTNHQGMLQFCSPNISTVGCCQIESDMALSDTQKSQAGFQAPKSAMGETVPVISHHFFFHGNLDLVSPSFYNVTPTLQNTSRFVATLNTTRRTKETASWRFLGTFPLRDFPIVFDIGGFRVRFSFRFPLF